MFKAVMMAAGIAIAAVTVAQAQINSGTGMPAICGQLKNKDDLLAYGEALRGLQSAMADIGGETDKAGEKEAMRQASLQMSKLIDEQQKCLTGGNGTAEKPYSAGETLERLEQFQLKVINNYLDTLEKEYSGTH